MKPPRTLPESGAEQHQRFVEAARELGCDESEERFDETLKRVAKHKPKPSQPGSAKPGKDNSGQ